MVLANEMDVSTFTGDYAFHVSGAHEGQWRRTRFENPALAKKVGRQLDALARLKPNWDGYGSPRIDANLITAARDFIRTVSGRIKFPTPKITPCAGGALQFEWHLGDKSLELELEDANTIHYLKWNPEEKIEEEDTFDIRDVTRAILLIKWFMGEVLHV